MPTTRTFVAEEDEMHWFCTSCGTDKLLAFSQRECPNCGAAQDPNTRYFPGSPKPNVQPRDIGVAPTRPTPDWICNFCGSANAFASSSCAACGAGKETDSKGVRLVPSTDGGETAAAAKNRIQQAEELLFTTRQAEADAKQRHARVQIGRAHV